MVAKAASTMFLVAMCWLAIAQTSAEEPTPTCSGGQAPADLEPFRAMLAKFGEDIKKDMAKFQAEFKEDIKTDMAEFKEDIKKDMAEFKDDITHALMALKYEVHDTTAMLDGCSIPMLADGIFMAMTLFEFNSVAWMVTAGHSVPSLTNAASLRCGNGPTEKVHRHALNLLAPAALQVPGAWHINASCDFALHRLASASLNVFRAAGFAPCLAGSSSPRVADETVLWSPNQAAKLSTGRLIGRTDNGDCPGTLLVDAPIRKGFSGSAAGARKTWVGISVAEVNEKGALELRFGNASNHDASSDRLYGQIVPVSHILTVIEHLQHHR